jgi:hypothetical protein
MPIVLAARQQLELLAQLIERSALAEGPQLPS